MTVYELKRTKTKRYWAVYREGRLVEQTDVWDGGDLFIRMLTMAASEADNTDSDILVRRESVASPGRFYEQTVKPSS